MNIGSLPEIDDIYEDDNVVFSHDNVHLAKTKAKNLGVGGAGLRYWKEDSDKIYRLEVNDGSKWIDNGRFAVAGNAEVIIKETYKTLSHTIYREGEPITVTADVPDKRWIFRRTSKKRVLGGLCGYRFWGSTETSRMPSYNVEGPQSTFIDSHLVYIPGWALISTKREDLTYQLIEVNIETGAETVLETITSPDITYTDPNNGVTYYISGHPDPSIYEPMVLPSSPISTGLWDIWYPWYGFVNSPWFWLQTFPKIEQAASFTTENGVWPQSELEWGSLSSHWYPVTDDNWENTGLFYKRLNGRYDGSSIIDDGPVYYTKYDWGEKFDYSKLDQFFDCGYMLLDIPGYQGLMSRDQWVDGTHETLSNLSSPKLIDMKVSSYTMAPNPYIYPIGGNTLNMYASPKTIDEYKWGGFEFAWLGCVDNISDIPYEGFDGHGKDIFHYIFHDAGVIAPGYYYTAIDKGEGEDSTYTFYSGYGNSNANPEPNPDDAKYKVRKDGVVDATGYLLNGKPLEGIQSVSVIPSSSMGSNPTKLATITTDSSDQEIYAPSTSWNGNYDSSTGSKIGTLSYGETDYDIYAPTEGGGGGGSKVEVISQWNPSDVTIPKQNILQLKVTTDNIPEIYDIYAPYSTIKDLVITPTYNTGTRIAYIDIYTSSTSYTRKNIYIPSEDKANYFGKKDISGSSTTLTSESSITVNNFTNYSGQSGFYLTRYAHYRVDGTIQFTGNSSTAWPDGGDEYLYFEVTSVSNMDSSCLPKAYLPIKYVRDHSAGTKLRLNFSCPFYNAYNYGSSPSLTIKIGLANASGTFTIPSYSGIVTFTRLD